MSYQLPQWGVGDEPTPQPGRQSSYDPYQSPQLYYAPLPQPPRKRFTARNYLIAIACCVATFFIVRALLPPINPRLSAVVLTGSGSGTHDTPGFTTDSDWSITYSFACSGSAGQDGFMVTVYDGGRMGDTPINVHAMKGSGTAYEHGNSGTHYLSVKTSCQWTFKANDGDVPK